MLCVLVYVIVLVGGLEQSSQVNGIGEIIESQSGNIRFECNNGKLKSPEKTKARHAIKLAAEILENIFLKKRVTIKVDYFSRCNEQGCRPAGLTANTYVTKRFVNNQNNQTTLYSQALANQHPEFLPHALRAPKPLDFTLEFGLDYDFYYPSDYPISISHNQTDFLVALFHEVTHGLGMNSRTLLTKNNFYKHIDNNPPPTLYHFPSRFDRFIYDSLTNQSISNAVRSLLPPNTPSRRQMYKDLVRTVLTPGRLVFRSMQGNDIPLYHQDGTSHLAFIYTGTQDELMVPAIVNGHSLASRILNNPDWHYAPYGPATIDILTTIGYQLKDPNPKCTLYSYFLYKEKNNVEESPCFSHLLKLN